MKYIMQRTDARKENLDNLYVLRSQFGSDLRIRLRSTVHIVPHDEACKNICEFGRSISLGCGKTMLRVEPESVKLFS